MKNLRWFIVANIAALLAVSIWFRCRELGNLPGINGDEAWYGVQAELVLHGEPISWRTPTGNLLNPLFFGPQLLLHACFKPSFALLRTTAVVSGLLALALSYLLCRKVFGVRAAVVSTIILAVLPINIVYSRLAWDACQSLLVTLPAVYWSLRSIFAPQWRLWFSAASLIALAASIVVHPTNLFIAPVIGVCLVTAWRDELQCVCRGWTMPLLLAGAAIAVFAVCDQARLAAIVNRLTDPAEYRAFAVNLGRLFSGETVYEYVSGAVSPGATGEQRWGLAAYDLAAVFVAGWLVLGFLRWMNNHKSNRSNGSEFAKPADDESANDEARRQTRRRLAARCLAIGWGLSLAAFFVVAGPAAIAPHFERYGICLIGPGAVLASLGICGWLESRTATKVITTFLALSLGWLLLLSAEANLFDFIHRTGGESHLTFRTAATEPKQLALEYVCRQSGRSAEVGAAEWWNYWPLRYLALGSPDNECRNVEIAYEELSSRLADPHRDKTVWQIEFSDSPSCRAVRQTLNEAGISAGEIVIHDFAHRPLLSVFRIPVTANAGLKHVSGPGPADRP